MTLIEPLRAKPFTVRRPPVDIQVGHRAEALAGNTVLARCVPEAGGDPGRFLHEIIREKDVRELVRVRVSWV